MYISKREQEATGNGDKTYKTSEERFARLRSLISKNRIEILCGLLALSGAVNASRLMCGTLKRESSREDAI